MSRYCLLPLMLGLLPGCLSASAGTGAEGEAAVSAAQGVDSSGSAQVSVSINPDTGEITVTSDAGQKVGTEQNANAEAIISAMAESNSELKATGWMAMGLIAAVVWGPRLIALLVNVLTKRGLFS